MQCLPVRVQVVYLLIGLSKRSRLTLCKCFLFFKPGTCRLHRTLFIAREHYLNEIFQHIFVYRPCIARPFDHTYNSPLAQGLFVFVFVFVGYRTNTIYTFLYSILLGRDANTIIHASEKYGCKIWRRSAYHKTNKNIRKTNSQYIFNFHY